MNNPGPATINPGLHSLIVIARLLDYPTQDLQDAAPAMLDIIDTETRLPVAQRQALMQFIQQLQTAILLDIQADYVETFERGRALSLLLFEHVHGESRARGQAMVDLLQQYRQAGLELSARELPDYIPLYLEYLATRPQDEAAQGLGDVYPILALLSARLQERGKAYHLLFDALLGMINIQPDMAGLRQQAAAEARDDTPAAMDAVWEEEMVNFVDDQGASCPSQMPLPQATRRTTTHTLHFQEPTHVTP